jgi:glyoxylase-like metal-dependent hydrolase (beta-lactamase superfamily II)
MRCGEFELSLISDGDFRLDGGAMFGVVPRTLWEKVKPPDARNRIRMATNCLLIARGRELLLIDSGIGDKHDDHFHAMFGVDPHAPRLPDSLRAAGYELEDVTHVLLSHLHFDHCGWSTRRQGDKLVPTFPHARYWIERGEAAHARRPNERDRASYEAQNWEPLFEAGVVELFDNQATPLPGVEAVKVPGHNGDMCIVLIDGAGGERVVYWADLVPTTAHVAYPWIMGYDLYPMQTLENKKLWLPRAVAGNWLGLFEHDAETPWARLVEERPGRLRAEPAEVASIAVNIAPPQ